MTWLPPNSSSPRSRTSHTKLRSSPVSSVRLNQTSLEIFQNGARIDVGATAAADSPRRAMPSNRGWEATLAKSWSFESLNLPPPRREGKSGSMGKG
jgi:hypothetical protein